MYTENGKERRALRARAHHLEAIVQIGQAGIHPPLVEKVAAELAVHELIKVRVRRTCLEDAKELGKPLAEAANAELVQVIGHTIVLYKPCTEDENDATATPQTD